MEIDVSLNVGYQDCMLYYLGELTHIEVEDSNGQRFRIHARHFRTFITILGVRGRFKIKLSATGELLSIKKLTHNQ